MIPKWQYRSRIGWLVAVVVLVWMINAFLRIRSKADYQPVYSLSAPAEYLNLFDSTAGSKLILTESINSKGRKPFCEFTYEGNFSVVVYELDLAWERALKDIIHQTIETVSRSSTVVYAGHKMPSYDLYFVMDSVGPIMDLFLTLNGDAVKEIINTDSIVGYSLRMDNYSIRYKADGVKDIFAEKKNAISVKVPVQLIFKRQGGQLFLLIITNPNDDRPIDHDLAQKLLRD